MCGEYDVELKQLEGTECARNGVPVNFAVEETELLAVVIPRTPERTYYLFWISQNTAARPIATTPPIFPHHFLPYYIGPAQPCWVV